MNREIRVARLNAAGTAWEQVVGGASPINQANNRDAFAPSLADVGGTPYVAWSEVTDTNSEIRVARLNAAGTAWVQGPPWTGVSATSGGINQSTDHGGFEPDLAVIGGRLLIAWRELDGTNSEIRVSRLNTPGTDWEQPSVLATATYGGINQATDRDGREPSLTSIGGVPHVAWRETDGTNFEIRVARLSAGGTAWEQLVGGASPINQANNRDGNDPSLASVGGAPYVAWDESDGTNAEIRAARLNAAGTAWEQPWTGAGATSGGINHATDRNAFLASVTEIGGTPHVAWEESDGANSEIRVSRLNAAAWQQVVGGASPINQENDDDGNAPSLLEVGGVPYVSWAEEDVSREEVRTSRLEPDFTAATAAPTQTGATLTTDVRTYGIPYPVGFQFGTALENETSTETTPAGAENVTVTRQVDGLGPATDHPFRPFATAGVPAPRVLGATGSFTTLAGPGDPGGPDRTGPDLELSGKRKQELSRKVAVTATCTNEPCELDATGKLKLPGGKSRGALKALKLRPASADAAAGEPRKLKLKLRKRSLKIANRALDRKDKGKARIAVTATDAAGNQTTLTRKVKVVG